MKGEPPSSASFAVLLTLLTSAPRKVICVCLQPWPPFLPHRAAPWAPCFLTNTWSVPECSPVTLCLNDRHRSPECRRWPRGSTKRAAFPPGPLAPDTVRYCPPGMGKAGLCVRAGSALRHSTGAARLTQLQTSRFLEKNRAYFYPSLIVYGLCVEKTLGSWRMQIMARTQ